MNTASAARLASLDAVTDERQPSTGLADELFAVVGLLESQPALRSALSDPTASNEAKTELATRLFGSGPNAATLSAAACTIIKEAVTLRWVTAADLVSALDRQGIRVLLALAAADSQLDTVESELFHFARVVAGDYELEGVINDRSSELGRREQIVRDLLADKVLPVSLTLALHAVAARRRTFDLTVQEILELAAQARNRAVAKVQVAKPLSAEQFDRLNLALTKQLGRAVTLQVEVNPEILGGVHIHIGDEDIDGTVLGRLTAAKQQLN